MLDSSVPPPRIYMGATIANNRDGRNSLFKWIDSNQSEWVHLLLRSNLDFPLAVVVSKAACLPTLADCTNYDDGKKSAMVVQKRLQLFRNSFQKYIVVPWWDEFFENRFQRWKHPEHTWKNTAWMDRYGISIGRYGRRNYRPEGTVLSNCIGNCENNSVILWLWFFWGICTMQSRWLSRLWKIGNCIRIESYNRVWKFICMHKRLRSIWTVSMNYVESLWRRRLESIQNFENLYRSRNRLFQRGCTRHYARIPS